LLQHCKDMEIVGFFNGIKLDAFRKNPLFGQTLNAAIEKIFNFPGRDGNNVIGDRIDTQGTSEFRYEGKT
ncbi:MAG: hypothetical protein J7J52_04495, partial [Deltaproteobacteria bacterium]|nr:hypothetical protein [Deltaproteobacteria bacterium]